MFLLDLMSRQSDKDSTSHDGIACVLLEKTSSVSSNSSNRNVFSADWGLEVDSVHGVYMVWFIAEDIKSACCTKLMRQHSGCAARNINSQLLDTPEWVAARRVPSMAPNPANHPIISRHSTRGGISLQPSGASANVRANKRRTS